MTITYYTVELILCILQGDAAIQKLKFFADKDAYFLWAKGTDVNKTDVSCHTWSATTYDVGDGGREEEGWELRGYLARSR